MSVVICKLPRAGLGNWLFPLMKASLFAHLNKLPLSVTNYRQFKIGPYLRGEKTKRNYDHFFTFQKSIARQCFDNLRFRSLNKYSVIEEPEVAVYNGKAGHHIFRFQTVPHWSNFFGGLIEHRALVIELFWDMVCDGVLDQVKLLAPPVIGVHIRMGDFRKLTEQQGFGKVGAVRTPEQYFISVIDSIRKVHGTDLPVSVFSDGFKHEFDQLLQLNNVSLVEGNSDIVDLLLLSKSKIIVSSAGSTFSYWAGFLSDAPFIMHPNYLCHPIRYGEHLYEGVFDPANLLLLKHIKTL